MIKGILRLLLQGVTDLGRNPLAQGLTLAAVTLIAFLCGLFLLFLHNLNLELSHVKGEVQFLVYWQARADAAAIKQQWAEMAKLPHLSDKTLFTPDEALKDLSKSLGPEVDLSWVKDRNPLPATALFVFSPPASKVKDSDQWSKDMLSTLKGYPLVDKVHTSPLRTDLAKAWGRFSNLVLWPLIVFLALVMALVVGNTLKLSLLSRQEEIEILQLVGARAWYIRLPLVVGGALQGGVGGFLALCMLRIVQVSLAEVLDFPPLNIRMAFLPFDQALILFGVLVGVGVVSSFFAARG